VAKANPSNSNPQHVDSLNSNIEEVRSLVAIHEKMTGAARGRRHKVAVLNKAGIVLAVSCWEAFVEDLARHSFDWLLHRAETPAVFPRKVLTLASKELRLDQDAGRVWELADKGWRAVLAKHRDQVLRESVGRLNTPRAKQVDALFSDLLGISQLSSSWRWHNVANDRIKNALEDLVTRRGEIAHRVVASRSVTKKDVKDSTTLVIRLATTSSNTIRQFLMSKVPAEAPWAEYVVGSD
jgi:hypothetical protein